MKSLGSHIVLSAAAFSLLLGAGGCADRSHLYEKTGLAYKRAFMVQGTERDVRQPRGLDAIDANIVMSNYRTMMVQEGKTPGGTAPGGAGAGNSTSMQVPGAK